MKNKITRGEWTNKKLEHSDSYDIWAETKNNALYLGTLDAEADNTNAEANADAICKAVNNTYGKGIDPEKIESLIDALKHVRRECNLDEWPSSRKVIHLALESIKLEDK